MNLVHCYLCVFFKDPFCSDIFSLSPAQLLVCPSKISHCTRSHPSHLDHSYLDDQFARNQGPHSHPKTLPLFSCPNLLLRNRHQIH